MLRDFQNASRDECELPDALELLAILSRLRASSVSYNTLLALQQFAKLHAKLRLVSGTRNLDRNNGIVVLRYQLTTRGNTSTVKCFNSTLA